MSSSLAVRSDSQTADRLWAEYARTSDPRTREAIILQFRRLAYSLAGRFSHAAPDEDLRQVSLLGLVKAVDRFDPATNNRFISFATPTILGEIRHYFRDHSRPVHVPRQAQERERKVQVARRELTERTGRTPSQAELAEWTGLDEREVSDALAMESAMRPVSLDAELSGSDQPNPGALEGCLGAPDKEMEAAEERIALQQAIDLLPNPTREVIRSRYLGGMSQRRVAERLGTSQMTVCRLERRGLEQLRRILAPPS